MTGFADLAPIVREQTVKAVLVVVPKLSDRVINGELLRHLAKTANDEQPGIRTNTTICLGKMAKNLGPSTRTKVLVAAFTRSLRDPFVHARSAALMALAATSDFFTEDDCALKILPAICPSLIDKEKIVRDQANKCLDQYLQRVKRYGQTLPDSILPSPEVAQTGAPRMGTPQNESSWAGWAISSFTNKLASASGEMQPSANGASTPTVNSPPLSRSASVPPGTDAKAGMQMPARSRPHPNTMPSAPAVSQLSSRSVSTSAAAEEEDFGEDWGAMDEEEVADAWGDPAEADRKAVEQKAAVKATPVAYDDQGEPDFEGWLNAQAQAKKTTKTALPKGLAKKATTTAAARSTSSLKTTTTVTKAPAKPTVSSPKPAVPAEDEDDDWGEAWG